MLTIMGIAAQNRGVQIEGSTANIVKVMASNPRRIVKIGVELNMISDCTLEQRNELERAGLACPVAKSLHPNIEQDISFSWKQ